MERLLLRCKWSSANGALGRSEMPLRLFPKGRVATILLTCDGWPGSRVILDMQYALEGQVIQRGTGANLGLPPARPT